MTRRSDSGLDGILLIDKPAGWTSHDVVAKARRITGQRRIGHTGTLDPMATGLLVLCLGRATRLVEYLSGHDKRYTGTVVLGATTTTDDAEGETIVRGPVPKLDVHSLEEALTLFRGPILQRPPAYSALKVAGRRAYDLARRGIVPDLPERTVTVHALSARISSPTDIEIDVTCSSGTYIRSIARDLGERLGCGGHLGALRRESAGPFEVGAAASLDELERAVSVSGLERLIFPADEGIAQFDAAILGREGASVVANGGAWRSDVAAGDGISALRIYSDSGDFVGVGMMSSLGEIRSRRTFLRRNLDNPTVM